MTVFLSGLASVQGQLFFLEWNNCLSGALRFSKCENQVVFCFVETTSFNLTSFGFRYVYAHAALYCSHSRILFRATKPLLNVRTYLPSSLLGSVHLLEPRLHPYLRPARKGFFVFLPSFRLKSFVIPASFPLSYPG